MVWRAKHLLIVITFFGLILGVAVAFIQRIQESSVATIVDFQWAGISQGEYPNGQRFDYSNLFETYVYSEALDQAGMDEITVGDLRGAVRIVPIIPNDVLEMIQYNLELGIQTSYFASQFKISVDNGKLNISVQQAQEVLSLLIEGFRDDFERKFIQRSVILDYTKSDLETFDYVDSLEILQTQVQLVRNAVNSVLPGASNFISSDLGIVFADIQVRTNLIETIELNNMASRINNYLLSKDKDLLITRYTYTVERMQLDLDKQNDIEVGLQDLVTNYTGSTVVIVIPGLDLSDQFATDPYLNTLYANVVSTQAEIARLQQDIIYYQLRIDRLEGNDPLFIVTPQKEAEEIEKVEESIQRSSDGLESIVEDMDVMLTEYNTILTKGLVKTLAAPQYDTNISMLLYAAFGLILGGMLGLGAIFINHSIKKARFEKEQLKS
ncbi:MAG: hypothetical protein IH571_01510 [Acholeplasmataceae bacterium]|nr:hypothetical protein [Acholeplasmataceae bacterium]